MQAEDMLNFFFTAALFALQAAQQLPHAPCEFDNTREPAGFAEQIAAPHYPVALFQQQGPWTCGYAVSRNGGGPQWVRTKTLRLVPADVHPQIEHWLGTWGTGENEIHIARTETGSLSLRGNAVWRGLGENVHVGEFEGQATPDGNLLHFSEAGDSCGIDFTLFGRYLYVRDNYQCGGANVTFRGIWTRLPK